MTEPPNEVIETAKAVQEAAKATGKAFETAGAFGRFVERIFGPLVEDSVGLVADRIKFYRQAKAIELQRRVEQLLAESKIIETRAVSPRVAVPLIEAATLADDSTLSERWARLLKNALDPNYSGEVSKRFVSILNELESDDVLVFEALMGMHFWGGSVGAPSGFVPSHHLPMMLRKLDIPSHRLELAVRNLQRVGLIQSLYEAESDDFAKKFRFRPKYTECFSISPFGKSFARAIK